MGIIAFRSGMNLALRYWQVLAALYITSLLTAGMAVILPALSLLGPAHRTAAAQVAEGLDIAFLMEALVSPSNLPVAGEAFLDTPREIQQAVSFLVLALFLSPLLAWLPASFIYGGVLSTYAASPQPFSWQSFFRGCWRWFGLFLLLGLVQGVINLVVAINLLLYLIFPAISANPLLALFLALLLLLFLGSSLILGELTRVAAVAREFPSLTGAFREALRLLRNHPLELVELYMLVLVLLAGLNGLIRLGVMPVTPHKAWVLVLLVQQGFVFSRLALRAVRLAGGVTLVVSQSQGAARNER